MRAAGGLGLGVGDSSSVGVGLQLCGGGELMWRGWE